MCLECDGYSFEEAMQALDLQIRVHGWVFQQIGTGAGSFSYTIGLLENYGHPELVVLDVWDDMQASILTALAAGIVEDGQLRAGDLAVTGVRCAEVDPIHLRDDRYFGTWANRYGRLPVAGEVLQVLLPDSAFCDGHVGLMRRLDLPEPTY
jgi:hypothetical protein